MKHTILTLLLIGFSFAAHAQTDLELALQNALDNCRNDYYELADKYYVMDSLAAKNLLTLRKQLTEAQKKVSQAEEEVQVIIDKQKKQHRKKNILAATLTGLIGFFGGYVVNLR